MSQADTTTITAREGEDPPAEAAPRVIRMPPRLRFIRLGADEPSVVLDVKPGGDVATACIAC